MDQARIDQASAALATWVGNVLELESTQVSLKPPGRTQEGKGVGVSLYLLELVDKPSARGTGRTPLQIQLRYLVTTWAEEPPEAQRLLGELAFAAMEREDMETQIEPLPSATWAALGVPPQPSFMLGVPISRQRPYVLAPPVRKPLAIEAGPIVGFYGLVIGILGSDRVPLAGARVELPALRLYTNTDSEGRFSFAGVPGRQSSKKLLVKARGREIAVTVDQPTSSGEPFAVELDLSD